MTEPVGDRCDYCSKPFGTSERAKHWTNKGTDWADYYTVHANQWECG